MARHSTVWWRAQRGAWCSKVDGRLITLARGRANRRQAVDALHRLLADRQQPTGPTVLPVGAIVTRWLAWAEGRADRGEMSPQTPADYVRRLGSFPDVCGSILVPDFRPHHLTAWLDGQTRWGATARHDAVGTVKACFRWALAEGLIDRDPLASIKRPPRPKRREHVMDPALWPTVRAAILSEPFRQLADFVWLTGCRPGEARRLEAHHVDLARKVATLPGKTTRRTGRPLTIRLPDAAVELIQPLIVRHPEGLLFRNQRGAPWTRNAVNWQIRRLRDRLAGQDTRGVVMYALRHLFATEGLLRGAGVTEVATLLNHASPRMLFDVYGHLADQHDHLRSTLETVRPALPEPAPPPVRPARSWKLKEPRKPRAKPDRAPSPQPGTTPSSS